MIDEIIIQGFRSFDQPQTFRFTDHKGFILVTGLNKVDPKLGANGTGKSTLFEGITWCLFGKTSTNLKAGDIKNWNTKTPCEVTIKFTTGDILKRTWSPNSLTLNNNTVTQEEVNSHIKLNFESFIYSIFISQFGAKFVDLTPAEKMNIFTFIMDDVLNKWTTFSDKAKTKSEDLESKVIKIDKEIASLQGSISSINISSLIELQTKWNKEQLEKVNEVNSKIVVINDSIKKYDIAKDEKVLNILKDKTEAFKAELTAILDAQNILLSEINELFKSKTILEADIKNEEKNKNSLDTSITLEKYAELEADLASSKEKLERKIKLNDEDKDKIRKLEIEQVTASNFYSIGRQEILKKENLIKLGQCPECEQPITGETFKLDYSKSEEYLTKLNELDSFIPKLKSVIEINTKEINSLSKQILIDEEDLKANKIKLDNKQKVIEIDKHINELNTELASINTNYTLKELQSIALKGDIVLKEQEYIIANTKYNEFYKELSEIKSKFNNLQTELKLLDDSILKLKEENNPWDEHIVLKAKELELLNKQLVALENELLDTKKYLEIYKYWIKGFKEIRLMLLAEALMDLEIHINNNLQKLGLGNWQIVLNVDSETKSGTIKKGFSVLVKSPTNNNLVPFECWSGGEAQRIRLALTIGISDFIKNKRGLDYNFIILDEPSQHLSEQGIEDLLTCLKEKVNSEDISIYLIEHKELKNSGIFDEIILIEKNELGSIINYD